MIEIERTGFMKKFITACLGISLVVTTFCSCAENNPHSEENSVSITESNSDTDMHPLVKVEMEKSPIAIFDMELSDAKEAVNSYSNLNATENMYVNAPEKSSVYSYTARSPLPEQMPQNFEKFFEEYKGYFKAFFPDKEMKDEYLFFTSSPEEVYLSDRKLIHENYDDLVSGKYTAVSPAYREDIDGLSKYNGEAAFSTAWGIGYGLLYMNKGKAVEKIGLGDFDYNPETPNSYLQLVGCQPEKYLAPVGRYSPESEKSFMLLNGEATIKSCVDYFEDFVNNKLPTPENANITTAVTDVEVLQFDNEHYCYHFYISRKLDNVITETMPTSYSHSFKGSYDMLSTKALMVECDDIDYMSGYHRIEGIDNGNVKTIDKIVSFETALKTVSEEMTELVKFDVEKIEFLYRQKYITTDEGYIDVDNGAPYEAVPAWKFTLFNSNDNKYYATYVYAESGELDYFTYTEV